MTALSAAAVAQRVRDLPALPAAVSELISSLNDPGLSAERLARQISLDQAITAKTLRLANSSFFGLPRQIHSIGDAAAVLGLRSIRNIATAAGLARAFDGCAPPVLDLPGFWRHAMGTALAAEALALQLDLDAGAAFTLGLLHDIGRLVLASDFAEPYHQVLAHQARHDCPVQQAERAVLGTDHGAVGALVAEQWNFAPQLVAAIALHHQPGETAAPAELDLVHLADNIAHALDLSPHEQAQVPPLVIASWTRLNPREEQLFEVFATVEQRHAALCQALLT